MGEEAWTFQEKQEEDGFLKVPQQKCGAVTMALVVERVDNGRLMGAVERDPLPVGRPLKHSGRYVRFVGHLFRPMIGLVRDAMCGERGL